MALRILVVDDLAFMREAIRDILEDSGFEIAGEAADGDAAVKAYRGLQPDVVLLDITMPVMNGLEALRRIRLIHNDAAVVMCSALGEQKYIIRAIQLGARDFIVKPFRPERIVSAVKKAVRYRA